MYKYLTIFSTNYCTKLIYKIIQLYKHIAVMHYVQLQYFKSI